MESRQLRLPYVLEKKIDDAMKFLSIVMGLRADDSIFCSELISFHYRNSLRQQMKKTNCIESDSERSDELHLRVF